MKKRIIKYFSLIFLTFIIIQFTSCKPNNKQHENKKEINKDIEELDGYNIVALNKLDSNLYLYNIASSVLEKKHKFKNVSEVQYDSSRKTYVFTENIGAGNNLIHNKILIYNSKEKIELMDCYNYKDIKLSKEGTKIAYSSYKEDSLDSVNDLKVYDIITKKNINIRSKVSISGNTYEWLNDDEILYYGAKKGEANSSAIYLYNVASGQEQVFLNDLNGFCSSIKVLNNNTIIYFIATIEDVKYLKIFNKATNKINTITMDLSEISYFSNVINKNIFFIGENKDTKNPEVCKLDIEKLSIEKINYDFPKKIDLNGGIAVSSDEKIYFCGFNNDNNKNDIYFYNNKDNSINLLSLNSGNYFVCSPSE